MQRCTAAYAVEIALMEQRNGFFTARLLRSKQDGGRDCPPDAVRGRGALEKLLTWEDRRRRSVKT